MEQITAQQPLPTFKRATAVKARLSGLFSGKWVDGETTSAKSMPNKVLELPSGEQVSRARVMGTVVGKFLSEDGKFASLTLDDSTETIRAKTWDSLKLIESVNIGDIVDLIGKVKFYNEETYLVPEIVKKVEDPNFELLRKLELIKKYGLDKTGQKASEKTPEKLDEKTDPRKQILQLIDESKDGVSYITILEKVKAPKDDIERVLNDFLSGGICYEPSPGVIRKI